MMMGYDGLFSSIAKTTRSGRHERDKGTARTEVYGGGNCCGTGWKDSEESSSLGF